MHRLRQIKKIHFESIYHFESFYHFESIFHLESIYATPAQVHRLRQVRKREIILSQATIDVDYG